MLTADHQAKVLSWRRQSSALGADRYRVTLIGRTGSAEGKTINLGKSRETDAPEHFYSAQEVEDLIPDLRRRNARGFDVYLTPIDRAHHFVVVDDMKPGATARLQNLGYQPCLVQASSADNEQAVIKVPRVDRSDEQSLANKVVQQLNVELGDPKFSGVVHPFRMAGFSNKKEGRQSAFTRVLFAAHRICIKTGEWLQGLRESADAATAKPQRARANDNTFGPSVTTQTQFSGDRTTDPVLVFVDAARRIRARAIASGLQKNESVIDYRACIRLLELGYTAATVADALLRGSDDLDMRHRDTQDYVQRTVSKAINEYLRKKDVDQQPGDSPAPPRPAG